MDSIDRSFEVFNADGTISKEVMRFAPLELEINKNTEKINTVVINLNSTDMFLEYNWLVKYNPEVNWNKGVRIKDNRLYLFLFYFSFLFPFPFIFLFLDLRLEVSIISQAITCYKKT